MQINGKSQRREIRPWDIWFGYRDAPRLVVGDEHWCGYYPRPDLIEMPSMALWGDPDWFLGFLFHELIHSTSHPFRLFRYYQRGNRDLWLALEELIAWIGAEILVEVSGMFSTVSIEIAHSIRLWTDETRDCGGSFEEAAAFATDAVDYILFGRRGRSHNMACRVCHHPELAEIKKELDNAGK